jgi:hypothetical protein
MYGRTITRVSLGALPLLAMLLIAAPPPVAALDGASCGGKGKVVCKTTSNCLRLGSYERCTTKYDYWQEDAEEIQEN